MSANLTTLNDYLFDSLDKLMQPDLTGDDLQAAISRSETVAKTATVIINNGRLALDALKHITEYGHRQDIEIPLLGILNDSKKNST